ncbi:MAG: multidrug ABC transporter ATP-binding protein, partial [Pseudooceanicola nanhaiensis]
MYRFFENLVDPFTRVPDGTPPATLWAFLGTQIAPFRHLVVWIALSGLIVALMEGGLIFYGGRLIDMMNASGAQAFWDDHWLEAVLVALFILVLRPVFIGLNALFLGQTLSSNL